MQYCDTASDYGFSVDWATNTAVKAAVSSNGMPMMALSECTSECADGHAHEPHAVAASQQPGHPQHGTAQVLRGGRLQALRVTQEEQNGEWLQEGTHPEAVQPPRVYKKSLLSQCAAVLQACVFSLARSLPACCFA